MKAGLIGDVIRSREHPDQNELLVQLREILNTVNARLDSGQTLQSLQLTIGDEFQGAYGSLSDVLEATLQLQLRSIGHIELRIGIGWGEIIVVDPEDVPRAQSGTAWWNAREAIKTVAKTRYERSWPRGYRTRFHGGDPQTTALVNSYLICCDQVLAGMDEKDAKVALALMDDRPQVALAGEIGITQSSVSRRQTDNGPATLYRALEMLRAGLS